LFGEPGYRFVLRACLLALAVAMLTACGWFGGEEIEDPPAELVKFEATLRIKKVWSDTIGDGTEALRLALAPATDGTLIFAAANDGKVTAYDAAKGRKLWRRKTRLPLSAGPTVGESLLVLGSNNGDVVALNREDGTTLWQTVVSSEVLAAPALTDELALVRTVDGKLIALRLADGTEAWFVQQSVPRLSVRGTGAPAVRGDVVVCGFDNGKLAAYSISDGSLLWEVLLTPPSGRTEVDRLADLNASVHVVGDDLYAAGYQGGLSAVAIESGQVLWSLEVASHAGMASDFLNLYVTARNSSIYAIARSTAREMWRDESLLNRDVSAPAAFGNSVVVGDFEGYVHFFSASTGKLSARVRAGSDRVSAAPLVVNEMIYVLTDAGKLFAFKDATPQEE
jgi:outer membrane protein assembly factor BamB